MKSLKASLGNPWPWLGLIGLAAAGPALAHPGGAAGHDLAAGLAHPLLGLDHLLTLIALGVLAGRSGGRAAAILPISFLAAAAFGAALALAGLGLPAVEPAILAALALLGVLLVAAARLGVGVGAALAAAVAVFHGFAHGAEIAPDASAVWYFAGFLAVSASVQGAGMALAFAGRRLWGETGANRATRLLGGALLAVGGALAAGGA